MTLLIIKLSGIHCNFLNEVIICENSSMCFDVLFADCIQHVFIPLLVELTLHLSLLALKLKICFGTCIDDSPILTSTGWPGLYPA